MTELQIAQARALAKCKFSPGSTEKRFVAWASWNAQNHPEFEISAKASAFLSRLAHSYRKQFGRCMARSCAKCPDSYLEIDVTPFAEATRRLFEHVRHAVWLDALGPPPHGSLREMQTDMPGWPRLLAFHLWNASALSASKNNEDQGFAVFLDQWVGS
jgi:hypothetical protein